jgi:hypothetical protein
VKEPVVQVHHVTYEPEWTEVVYKGEHYVLSLVQRRKRFSQGFIQAMTFELNRAKKVAVSLGEPDPSLYRRVKKQERL